MYVNVMRHGVSQHFLSQALEIFLYPIIDDNEIKNKYIVDHHMINRPANMLDEHSSRKHISRRTFS